MPDIKSNVVFYSIKQLTTSRCWKRCSAALSTRWLSSTLALLFQSLRVFDGQSQVPPCPTASTGSALHGKAAGVNLKRGSKRTCIFPCPRSLPLLAAAVEKRIWRWQGKAAINSTPCASLWNGRWLRDESGCMCVCVLNPREGILCFSWLKKKNRVCMCVFGRVRRGWWVE